MWFTVIRVSPKWLVSTCSKIAGRTAKAGGSKEEGSGRGEGGRGRKARLEKLVQVGGFLEAILSPSFLPPSLPTVLTQALPGHTHHRVNGRLVVGTATGSEAFVSVYLAGALVGAEGEKEGRREGGGVRRLGG